MGVRKQLMKEYGRDPLYAAILNAKTKGATLKAIDSLQSIRGNMAYKNFYNRCKYLSLLKG